VTDDSNQQEQKHADMIRWTVFSDATKYTSVDTFLPQRRTQHISLER